MTGPVTRALPWADPADWFARLADRPGIAFLDSAAAGDPRATASYIAADPAEEVRLPVASMAEAIAALRRIAPVFAPQDAPLPFTGGLIGMLAYDAGPDAVKTVSRHAPDPELPALIVRRYDLVLGFDHEARRAWGFARPRDGLSGDARLDALLATPPAPPLETAPPAWHEETPPAAHHAKIAAVLDFLRAGDIYQANISTRFTAPRPAGFSPAAAYASLRARSPAPFAAYLDLGDGAALLSASPERFVQCDAGGAIETRPIKGTAPRDADPARDRANGERLAASAKDRAENLMICDLLRNDLSIVAEEGSVRVSQMAALERFASVWHLVSAVHGRLRDGRDAIDLIAATFPGGSITGAPKRRAVEIIDQLEDSPRGPFFGIVFALGEDGALDSSIIIRSIVATPTRLIARAGGGIVADSDPAAEYAELRAKIDPVIGEASTSGTF